MLKSRTQTAALAKQHAAKLGTTTSGIMSQFLALPVVSEQDKIPAGCRKQVHHFTQVMIEDKATGEFVARGETTFEGIEIIKDDDKKEEDKIPLGRFFASLCDDAGSADHKKKKTTMFTTYAGRAAASAAKVEEDPPQVVVAESRISTAIAADPIKAAQSDSYLAKSKEYLTTKGVPKEKWFIKPNFQYPEGYTPKDPSWALPWKKFLKGIEKGKGKFVFEDHECDEFLLKYKPAEDEIPSHFMCADDYSPKDLRWATKVKKFIENRNSGYCTDEQCNKFLENLKTELTRKGVRPENMFVPSKFNCSPDFYPEDDFWVEKVEAHKLRKGFMLVEDEQPQQRAPTTSFPLSEAKVSPPRRRKGTAQGTRHTTSGCWSKHEDAVAAGSPTLPTPPQSRYASPVKADK